MVRRIIIIERKIITQFILAYTSEDDRQLKEKWERSIVTYYKSYEKTLKKQKSIMKNIEE